MKKKNLIIVIISILIFYIIISIIFRWELTKIKSDSKPTNSATTEAIIPEKETEQSTSLETSDKPSTEITTEGEINDFSDIIDYSNSDKEEKERITKLVMSESDNKKQPDKEKNDISSDNKNIDPTNILTEKGKAFHESFDYSDSTLNQDKYITDFGYALSSKVLKDANVTSYVVGKDIAPGKYVLSANGASGEFTIKPKTLNEQNLYLSYFINKDLPDTRINSVCYTFTDKYNEHDTAVIQLERDMTIEILDSDTSSPLFAYLYVLEEK